MLHVSMGEGDVRDATSRSESGSVDQELLRLAAVDDEELYSPSAPSLSPQYDNAPSPQTFDSS